MTSFRSYPKPDFMSPAVAAAVREAEQQGIDLDLYSKGKTLRKFGRRTDLASGVSTTLWEAPSANETLLTSNGITHVVSSSAADTIEVYYEGHTISGTDLTFVTGTVTLTGQTPVALPTAVARASRIRNNTETPLVGTISVMEGTDVTSGVPNTAAEVHLEIPAGEQQSRKCQTAISSVDAFLLTELHADILGATSARVDITLQVKRPGRVWLPLFDTGVGTVGASSIYVPINPAILVFPNSDIRVVAKANTNNTDVSAFFSGVLASVVT